MCESLWDHTRLILASLLLLLISQSVSMKLVNEASQIFTFCHLCRTNSLNVMFCFGVVYLSCQVLVVHLVGILSFVWWYWWHSWCLSAFLLIYHERGGVVFPVTVHGYSCSLILRLQLDIYAVLWLIFMWSPYPWSPVETTLCSLLFVDITPVCTTFVASQWVMMLLRTCIVMSQWVMTLLCVHIMASQCIVMLLWTSFGRYYYAKLWYCCFTSKLVKIVHINH